ncbi:hypothetical protein HK096_006275 [Nowakowskiella sp. JEL0078]|nr:hypothetical protein HK096_006275 [Nowakowskiella sp. JEL0078]
MGENTKYNEQKKRIFFHFRSLVLSDNTPSASILDSRLLHNLAVAKYYMNPSDLPNKDSVSTNNPTPDSAEDAFVVDSWEDTLDYDDETSFLRNSTTLSSEPNITFQLSRLFHDLDSATNLSQTQPSIPDLHLQLKNQSEMEEDEINDENNSRCLEDRENTIDAVLYSKATNYFQISDSAVYVYNKCLLLFSFRRYEVARKQLESIFFLNSASNNRFVDMDQETTFFDIVDDHMALKISWLLVDVYFALNLIPEAEIVLNCIENGFEEMIERDSEYLASTSNNSKSESHYDPNEVGQFLNIDNLLQILLNILLEGNSELEISMLDKITDSRYDTSSKPSFVPTLDELITCYTPNMNIYRNRLSFLKSLNEMQCELEITTESPQHSLWFYRAQFCNISGKFDDAFKNLTLEHQERKLILKIKVDELTEKLSDGFLIEPNESNDLLLLDKIFYGNLGNIYASIGRRQLSLVCYKKAIELNKKHLEQITWQFAENIISIGPSSILLQDISPQLIFNSGVMNLQNGKPELAFQCFRKTLMSLHFSNDSVGNSWHSLKERIGVDDYLFWLKFGEACVACYSVQKDSAASFYRIVLHPFIG